MGESDQKLESWKEIADYVGRTVRTVQRWEKTKGLPVRRLPGGSQERVFAYREELDEWQRGEGAKANAEHRTPNIERRREEGEILNGDGERRTLNAQRSTFNAEPAAAGKWRRWGWAVAAAVVMIGLAVGAAAIWWAGWGGGRGAGRESGVSGVRIEGHTLTALDPTGTELWKKTFPRRLYGEADYRNAWPLLADERYRFWAVADVDGDGRNEVMVLSGAPEGGQTFRDTLHCFEAGGAERWRMTVGESLTYGHRTYSDLWRIHYFLLFGRNPAGGRYILLDTRHHEDFPAALLLLDGRGRVCGKYYNGGWTAQILPLDLDGDGLEELVCTGINNGYKKICLFVLDPRNMWGASPTAGIPDYRCQRLSAGTETHYLLLPWCCLADVLRNSVLIPPLEAADRWICLRIDFEAPPVSGGPFHYYFRYDLSLDHAMPSSYYIELHNYLAKRGLLDHSFSDAELAAMEPVLYWDGERFIPTPAKNSHRGNR